ncbi:hypothetical protein MIZ03_2680 [Rhodoferax lithotrophicus]|uniref:STAS/SEC14 domain-containing protein n=1 Tax=Rhodoferax lithotrophicus TaxID=2798804 RepID=A0ABM7MNF3_9BURK|nr:hypothetical protein [Rhodoferax sp. MIZ03]BCO27789.1 hypothetical protein MIZ03_2680 [Rhodoferax sp. MIZ03]
MSYSVSWISHGCNVTYSDRVTFEEFMGSILAIHAHENYDVISYVIHDMTNVAELDFSEVDMTRIVAHELGARFTNPHVRPAVVSTNTTMGSMTRAFNEITKLEIGFFPTVREANDWVKGTQSTA